jgi:hypothetical protein
MQLNWLMIIEREALNAYDAILIMKTTSSMSPFQDFYWS